LTNKKGARDRLEEIKGEGGAIRLMRSRAKRIEEG
jgi:hypothetical protein